MKTQIYKKQVELLLMIIPEINKESCFALHGGTAINLFVRNMPRLSIDIDMTYVYIEKREETLKNIEYSLKRIAYNIKKIDNDIKIDYLNKKGKLIITNNSAVVKIEVNLVNRGLISNPVKSILSEKAQKEFDTFNEIQIVPYGQLYGGKICAALDRQHPRDIFDIKYLLKSTGINNEVKKGFLLSLLSSPRPTHEILNPNILNQETTMKNQFLGMSEENFTYNDFEEIRNKLIEEINNLFTDTDKSFILSFNQSNPDWKIYDFRDFPSIQWKLKNINILKKENPEKFKNQLLKLEEVLANN